MPLVAGPGIREQVALWVSDRAGDISSLAPGFEAIGVVNRDGQLVAGCVYTNHRAKNRTIEMWCAGEGAWLTPHKLREMLGYPFNQLGCHRITLMVERTNEKSRAFVERLGFIKEGACKDLYGPGKTVLIYRMLKHECRWLNHG